MGKGVLGRVMRGSTVMVVAFTSAMRGREMVHKCQRSAEPVIKWNDDDSLNGRRKRRKGDSQAYEGK